MEHGAGRAERQLIGSRGSRFDRPDTACEARVPTELDVGRRNKKNSGRVAGLGHGLVR
jgi:hypothetical protein